jgi:D-glycero-D-manno-heptose 1,7-bisphosphate phosphatase
MSDFVILDRDGVINVDLMTYVTRPEDFEPIQGSLEAISLLNKNGFKVAIATNQACIEKNIITDEELSEVHNYMLKLLKEVGGNIEYIAYCPHSPDSQCKCRKPQTGLLEEIEAHLKIDLKGSYFIGDKDSDILAGRSHGCTPLLIKTGGYGEKVFGSLNSPPIEHCFDNLMGAVEFILKTSDENS